MRRLYYLLSDFLFLKIFRRMPVYYFDSEKNVGDLIAPYILERITGRRSHNTKSRAFPHLISVGSLIHRAKRTSDVWGTGTLGVDKKAKYSFGELKVYALRGYLSKENFCGENNSDANIALGDPAILMPRFFDPPRSVKYRVGVVPHYRDLGLDIFSDKNKYRILDVHLGPEEFISELVQCQYIISSSLHGLILADAYGIQNKWVSFSNKLTGGDFKFNDYYSTTIRPDEVGLKIKDKVTFYRLLEDIESVASVKKFALSEDDLLSSFPKHYLK